jgi:hypothetical protein
MARSFFLGWRKAASHKLLAASLIQEGFANGIPERTHPSPFTKNHKKQKTGDK